MRSVGNVLLVGWTPFSKVPDDSGIRGQSVLSKREHPCLMDDLIPFELVLLPRLALLRKCRAQFRPVNPELFPDFKIEPEPACPKAYSKNRISHPMAGQIRDPGSIVCWRVGSDVPAGNVTVKQVLNMPSPIPRLPVGRCICVKRQHRWIILRPIRIVKSLADKISSRSHAYPSTFWRCIHRGHQENLPTCPRLPGAQPDTGTSYKQQRFPTQFQRCDSKSSQPHAGEHQGQPSLWWRCGADHGSASRTFRTGHGYGAMPC